MTQLLLEPARRSGCEDMPAVSELLKDAAQRQRSPIDDLLDAAIVDEESYLRELAHDLDLPWLASIPMEENTTPLREVCGPQIALRHRLLPVAIEGEGDERKLLLATFDPFNLIAHQAAAQELEIPFEWCMASRKRIHEALRRLYGVGADTFEHI
ncbi:MAG: type II/IV secretion system protein, partial [Luteolibacter sp.]